MIHVFLAIAPLFLIIFATAALQRWKHIDKHWSEVLNEFALKIGLPVLIFSALAKSPFALADHAGVIFVNSLFCVILFFCTLALCRMFRLSAEMTRTIIAGLMFGNIAYLGIPILTQIYDASILPRVSVIIATWFFWFFTLVTGYVTMSRQRKGDGVFARTCQALLGNPLLIAVALGLLFASFSLSLPSVVVTALDMVSASVTPTVLIVIGLFIGKSPLGSFNDWIPAFALSALTLLALPAGMYFGLQLFGLSPHTYAISIIEIAMPFAITPFALADEYGLNKAWISRSIVLSTILSVLTLPFWISIL
ncbi:AEC family transporter [Candidatus Uhrbacteria bacterium]|nr:AEC family transporter [Candidatus Uhrbacteria bacterium]